jgi:ketosteroid isomerase-like protein
MTDTPENPLALLKEYYDRVDDGEFVVASELFTPDCSYYLPTMEPDKAGRGRDSVISALEDRGHKDYDHVLQKGRVLLDNRVFIVGTTTAPGADEYAFFAQAETVDDHIAAYIAGAIHELTPDGRF